MLNKVENVSEGKTLIKEKLHNNKAREVFCDMLVAQGVDRDIAQKLCSPGSNPYEILTKAKQEQHIFAVKDGIVTSIDSLEVARVCVKLGAGRFHPDDEIDHSVGVVLDVRVGQYVSRNSLLVTVYHKGNFTNEEELQLREAIQIADSDTTDDLLPRSRIIRVVDEV